MKKMLHNYIIFNYLHTCLHMHMYIPKHTSTTFLLYIPWEHSPTFVTAASLPD